VSEQQDRSVKTWASMAASVVIKEDRPEGTNEQPPQPVATVIDRRNRLAGTKQRSGALPNRSCRGPALEESQDEQAAAVDVLDMSSTGKEALSCGAGNLSTLAEVQTPTHSSVYLKGDKAPQDTRHIAEPALTVLHIAKAQSNSLTAPAKVLDRLSDDVMELILVEVKMSGYYLRPPYSHMSAGEVMKRLQTLRNRGNIHNKLVTAIQKRLNTIPDVKARRKEAYEIAMRCLGVPDGHVDVVMRDGPDARASFRSLERGRPWQALSFWGFLNQHAPRLISQGYREAPEPAPAAGSHQQRRNSVAAAPMAHDQPVPLRSSSNDLHAIRDFLTHTLRPEMERMRASGSIPDPYLDDMESACSGLRAPQTQEARVVLLGQNALGKTTAVMSLAQATEVTAAEYDANNGKQDIRSTTHLLTPEWDVLKIALGKEATKLLSPAEALSELRRVMGYPEDTSPEVWRERMKMPTAEEIQRHVGEIADLTKYLEDPTSLFKNGSHTYAAPVGNSTSTTTGRTMEFKYASQFSILIKLPDTTEMLQQRAHQYIILLLELRDTMKAIEEGTKTRADLDLLKENLPNCRGDYNAVTGRPMEVGPQAWRDMTMEEIEEELEGLPADYQDVRLCRHAEDLVKHPYKTLFTGGEHGRDGDRLAFKMQLDLLNGSLHWQQAAAFTAAVDEDDDDDEYKEVDDDDEATPVQPAMPVYDCEVIQAGLREAQLIERCICYGPWGILQDGIVMVDPPGLGVTHPEHLKQQEIILGPVEQGGAEIVLAVVEKHWSSSPAVPQALQRFNIMKDHMEGKKLLIVGRMCEKHELMETGQLWYLSKKGDTARNTKFKRLVRPDIVHGLEKLAANSGLSYNTKSIPILNLSWVTYFAALQAPTWLLKPAKIWSRFSVMNSTCMPELIGALEHWRLRKTVTEVADCCEQFARAHRVLRRMRQPASLTRQQLRLVAHPPDEAAVPSIAPAQQAAQEADYQLARDQVRCLISFAINGEHPTPELEDRLPHLRSKDDLVEDCTSDMRQLVEAKAIGVRSLKAGLKGGRFTINAHTPPRSGGEEVPKKPNNTLAEWVLSKEDAGASLVNDITAGIDERIAELLQELVDKERALCFTALVDGMTGRLAGQGVVRPGGTANLAKQVGRLVEVYLAAKERHLHAAQTSMAKFLTIQQNTFRGVGKKVYKAVVAREAGALLPQGLNNVDEDVAIVMRAVVTTARREWLDTLSESMLAAWDRIVEQLAAATATLIGDFGKWVERRVQGDLMPNVHISSTISSLSGIVSTGEAALNNVLTEITTATSDTDITSAKDLRQHSQPLLQEVVRASQLAYCLSGDLQNSQALPNRSPMPLGPLHSLRRVLSLRSVTVLVDSSKDPATPLSATTTLQVLEKVADAMLRGNDSDRNSRKFAELAAQFKEETEHSLGEALFQAAYQSGEVGGDDDGGSTVARILQRCQELCIPVDNQQRPTLLHALVSWCRIHEVDVILLGGNGKAAYIQGSQVPYVSAYIFFVKAPTREHGIANLQSFEEHCSFYPAVSANQGVADTAPEEPRVAVATLRPSGRKRKRAPGDGQPCAVCAEDRSLKGNEMLLCSNGTSCAHQDMRGYHLQCLDPPLLAIPRGKWYCPACTLLDANTADQTGGGGAACSVPTSGIEADEVPGNDMAVLAAQPSAAEAPTTPRGILNDLWEYNGATWPLETLIVSQVTSEGDFKGHSYWSRRHGDGTELALYESLYDMYRSRYAQFVEAISFCLPSWKKVANGSTGHAGEDASIITSYVGAIFEGLSGESPDCCSHSALKSLWLAEECEAAAENLASTKTGTLNDMGTYNHAYHILVKAAAEVVRNHSPTRNLGSTTCLIAATFHKQLHVALTGNCQLAVLRYHEEQGLQVKLLTTRTYMPHDLAAAEEENGPPPGQLDVSQQGEVENWQQHHPERLQCITFDLEEGDIVLAGSHGFFDNLKWHMSPGQDEPAKIKSRLEELCQAFVSEFEPIDSEMVANLGLELYESAKLHMHRLSPSPLGSEGTRGLPSEPDDLTLWVARVSFRREPPGPVPEEAFQPAPVGSSKPFVDTKQVDEHPLPNHCQRKIASVSKNPRRRALPPRTEGAVDGQLKHWRFKYV